MDDRQIIDLYLERAESAISETEKKYGRYCRYISHNILGDDLDAEEIANDTYLKVWNTIPPACPSSLKAYVGMISRQLSLNRYDKEHAQKRGNRVDILAGELYECIPEDRCFEDRIALRDALNAFIADLPQKAQKIFVRRYFYASSIEEIANDYRVSESSVAVILFRTRKRLKRYLEKEGLER